MSLDMDAMDDSGRYSVVVSPVIKTVLLYQRNDVQLLATPPSNCPDPNHYAQVMSSYMKEAGNGGKTVFKLLASHVEGKTSFYIEFDGDFLKDMIRMLPFPYVELQGDVIDEDKCLHEFLPFDKRFELQEYMDMWAKSTGETGSPTFWQNLLSFQTTCDGADPADAQGNREVSVKCFLTLGWVHPIQISPNTFLMNLFNNECSKDLTIVAGNGAELRCHRIIFAGHSNVLAAMLSNQTGMQEAQSGRIEMRENSEEGVKHLLRYLYGIELTTTTGVQQGLGCEVAVELFETAHKYELLPLRDGLGKFLLEKRSEWFAPAPDALLELYFFLEKLTEFEGLLEHTISLMTSLSDEIRACERFQELSRKEALDLVWKLFDLK